MRQPGGAYNGFFVEVDGAAHFREGEDVVLFLSPAPKLPGVFLPMALAASKVSLVHKTGELRALRRLDGLAFVKPGSFEALRPVGGEEDLGRAQTFLETLRAWVKGGAR